MHIVKFDHRRLLASFVAALARNPALGQMVRPRVPLKAALLTMSLVLATSAQASACKLTVLGDSLAAGYGVAESEAFPVRLEAALRAQGVDCAVINGGVSGDTSAGGAARLDWVLADAPTHLLIELGGNDALRALPADELRKNLASIIERAKARGVEVMLAGMLAPPNLGRTYGEAFAGVYTGLAQSYDVPLYPFFLDGAVLDRTLMQPDGIHPNAQGVEVIVARIAPSVASWIKDE
jgi:acyl-CoA thioesterase-1